MVDIVHILLVSMENAFCCFLALCTEKVTQFIDVYTDSDTVTVGTETSESENCYVRNTCLQVSFNCVTVVQLFTLKAYLNRMEEADTSCCYL